jgi:hypothetical protein
VLFYEVTEVPGHSRGVVREENSAIRRSQRQHVWIGQSIGDQPREQIGCRFQAIGA